MTALPVPPYIYNAMPLVWHDGDTGMFRIDLGFGCSYSTSIRLLGCNAIELGKPGGKEARDHLQALVPAGTRVSMASVKDDKYGGRYDAAVTYLGPDGQPRDLVADLVAGQWAAAWNGAGAKPVPPWPRTVTP